MKVFERIKCLFEHCGREFESRNALGIHIRRSHKISKAQYAELFKTDEWIKCKICNKYHYMEMVYQKLGRSCCSKECHYKASSQSFIKRNKEHPEEVARRAKYVKAARLANDLDSYKKSGAKAAITSKENNTNKIGIERLRFLLKNDEEFKARYHLKAKKVAEQRRTRGDFDNFEKLSIAAKKGAETCRRRGTKHLQTMKGVETARKNGSYQKAQIKRLQKLPQIIEKIIQTKGWINRRTKFKKGKYISNKTEELCVFDSSYEYIRFKQLDARSDVLYWHKNQSEKIEYIDQNNTIHYCFPDIFVVYNDLSIEIEEVKGQETLSSCIKADAIKEFCRKNNMKFGYFCIDNLFFDNWKQVHKDFIQNYTDRYRIYN
jgi:hypothetical protein